MNTSKEPAPAAVSERAKQAGEIHAKWHWTEPSVWTDNMLKALEYGVKGGKWFSIIDKVWSLENLRSAYAEVRRNGGAPGIDNQSVKRFGRDLERELARLHQDLKEGRYQPRPARRHWIDKPGSTAKRPLGIPTVRDRVVEAALKHVLEPIFEREFADCSYGFRPGRGTKDALREVNRLLKAGHLIVVEVDIQSFFDHISHDRLMALVERRVSDGRVLELVRMMLEKGILDKDRYQPTSEGTPQGGVISPLLTNIYLNGLDHEMQQSGFRVVRYADDLVVLCDSLEQAQNAMQRLSVWMLAMGLTLHPEKTGIVDMTALGSCFDFLGYQFARSKRTGLLRRFVSGKSERRIRVRLCPYLKRCNGRSLEKIIEKINPILRGWYGYFKHAAVSSLLGVDGWVRGRLRSILRKRRGGRGRGRGIDHYRWKNAYFVKRGLFTLSLAHAKELQSLRG